MTLSSANTALASSEPMICSRREAETPCCLNFSSTCRVS
ncbi:Uncharacterised protein [Vibrio cholerae]|nr:Uncharacterised protein [Vibrio cholerae]